MGEILKVSTSTHVIDQLGTESMSLPAGKSLLDYEQSVKIRVNLDVEFKLE